MALAALIVAAALLIGSWLVVPAMAQTEHGVIPPIVLESNEPGQLVITWETPDPKPTDYRLKWAHSSLSYLSYRYDNEPQRGNDYPEINTFTLNNLTPGETYKVQLRSRYYDADKSTSRPSGPWTATATQQIKNNPPAATKSKETPHLQIHRAVDTTNPTFVSGTANGAVIVLTFSEELDPNSLPPGSAFDVSAYNLIDMTDVSIDVTNVAINGATVTLTLKSAIIVDEIIMYTIMPTLGRHGSTARPRWKCGPSWRRK